MVLRDHFPPKSSWPWNTLVNTLHNLQPPGLEMLVTSSEISLVWFCSLLSMRVWCLFIEWALTITERDQFLSSQEFGKADILWTKWYLNMYHSVTNPLSHLLGHSHFVLTHPTIPFWLMREAKGGTLFCIFLSVFRVC